MHPQLTKLFIVVQAQNDVPVPTAQKVEKYKTRTGTAMKLAKNVGFGSAVACGKIAVLPFKSKLLNFQISLSLCGLLYSVSSTYVLTQDSAVWYMSETASYGVRALQGLDRPEHKNHDQDAEQTSNVNDSRVFNEGNVLNLRSVKDIIFNDLYVVIEIDITSLGRDDAYTRAITASGIRRSTTQTRDGDGLSVGSPRSHSSAPSGKME